MVARRAGKTGRRNPCPRPAEVRPVSASLMRRFLPEWRRDALRTSLWFVPTLQIAAAAVLFGLTYRLDRLAYAGDLTLPPWVNNGSADAARQILTAIAAAVITVIGLVFSITIVALTLASTQFGPHAAQVRARPGDAADAGDLR